MELQKCQMVLLIGETRFREIEIVSGVTLCEITRPAYIETVLILDLYDLAIVRHSKNFRAVDGRVLNSITVYRYFTKRSEAEQVADSLVKTVLANSAGAHKQQKGVKCD